MDAQELLESPFAFLPPAKLLEGLTAEEAAAKPHGPHSIVEILAHIHYWQNWFLDRCEGKGSPIAASASVGWPAVSAADWEPLREQFLSGLARAVAIGSASDAATRKIEPAIEFPPLAHYTVKDAIVHAAVHNAHHLGQIVTLRQIAGKWPPPAGSCTW